MKTRTPRITQPEAGNPNPELNHQRAMSLTSRWPLQDTSAPYQLTYQANGQVQQRAEISNRQ